MTSILGPRKLHLWKGIWQLTNSQTANDLRCCVYDFRKTQMCTVKNQADILHFAIKFFTYLAPAFSKRFCINLFSHDCRDNRGARKGSGPPPTLPSRCGGAVGGKGCLIWQLLSHRLSQRGKSNPAPTRSMGPERNSAGKVLGCGGEKQTVLLSLKGKNSVF